MPTGKWDKYFITELKKDIKVPEFRKSRPGEELPAGERKAADHLIWLDDTVIPNARIYSEVMWLWPGDRRAADAAGKHRGKTAVEEHSHPFEEVIAFFGSDLQDPHDLHGEIELWLDGEQHILNKSFMAFVPAGMKHCPLIIHRVDKPIMHFTIGPSSKYAGGGQSASQKGSEGKKASGRHTDKYIVTKLQHPKVEGQWSPPPTAAEKGHGGRILFLDNDVVRGSFYVEVVWVTPPLPGAKRPVIPEGKEYEMSPIRPHKHDYDEVLSLFGSNPNDIHDLGGEVWLWVEDEKHVATKSTMVYLPAGTMHCPLVYKRVDRPMFHFTSFPGGKTYVE